VRLTNSLIIVIFLLKTIMATVDATKYYFTNRIINVWNSLPNCVVTAPTLPFFRRQIAKIDLSRFCVSFYFCNICTFFNL